MGDRCRDLADIVTVSVETNAVGAALQAGPFLLGAYGGNGSGVGLRSGCIGSYDFAEEVILLSGKKMFAPNSDREGKPYHLESCVLAFPFQVLALGMIHVPFGLLGIEPSWTVAKLWREERPLKLEDGYWCTYLQCEVAFGAVIGVRAGLNPAELLDFILGWAGIDICSDDQERKRRQLKEIADGIDQGKGALKLHEGPKEDKK